VGEWVLGSDQRTKGRLFETEAPSTEKAQFFLTEVRAKGTSRRLLSQANCFASTSIKGTSSSFRGI